MQIIRPKRTAEKCGMALPTLWRKAKDDPDFPKPIKLSESLTGFVEAEVDAYLEKKVRESREQPTKRLTSAGASAASAKSRAAKRATMAAGGVQ
jgi:prophage regulatory protein